LDLVWGGFLVGCFRWVFQKTTGFLGCVPRCFNPDLLWHCYDLAYSPLLYCFRFNLSSDTGL